MISKERNEPGSGYASGQNMRFLYEKTAKCTIYSGNQYYRLLLVLCAKRSSDG